MKRMILSVMILISLVAGVNAIKEGTVDINDAKQERIILIKNMSTFDTDRLSELLKNKSKVRFYYSVDSVGLLCVYRFEEIKNVP